MRAALFFLVSILLAAQSDDLAIKSRQAKELMAQGRFADAIPLYQELTKALPANTGLRLNLGIALQMAGFQNEAIPQFERVLQNEPNSVPAQAMLANGLLSLDRPREAAVHFRKLTTLTPNDPRAWFGLGRSYEMLAGTSFEELTKTAQGSAEWLTLVAESRVARRQYRAAFYFYKQALEKQSTFRDAHAGIATVYRATNHADWAQAEERKETALDCVREKAACDFKAGRFLEAAAAKSAYWQTRAFNDLARQSFSKLGKLPESVELHALTAEMMSGHGDFLPAADEWRAALKLAPGDARIEHELARALYEGQDYAKALPMLRDQLRREPASTDLNFFAGDAYLRSEQPDQALPYLMTAVKLEAKFLPAHASLGLTLMRLNRAAEAVPHLLASLDLDNDGSLHYQLSRAYQASGETAKAREAMAKYQEIQRATEASKRELEDKVQITAP